MLVPEGRRVFPNLSVLENLRIGAYLRRDKEEIRRNIEYVFDRFPRLKERHWQEAGTLSGGEQQMLAVGRALMARPKLLMMDEPSLGLAPLIVRDIFSIIQRLSDEGITILLIEQNANAAAGRHYGYVLETGRIASPAPGRSCCSTSPCGTPTWGPAAGRQGRPPPRPRPSSRVRISAKGQPRRGS